jgi:hypothetical protein
MLNNNFEKTDRNNELYRRHMHGEKYESIALDYEISRQRVEQICNDIKKRRSAENDELFNIIFEFCGDKRLSKRICCSLKRQYWMKDVLQEIKRASLSEISRINNIGSKSLDIVSQIKEQLELKPI